MSSFYSTCASILLMSFGSNKTRYCQDAISRSKLLIAIVLVTLLVTSICSHAGLENAYAMKKGSHHSEASKKKISESLKKYHRTGLTKKQRGEK